MGRDQQLPILRQPIIELEKLEDRSDVLTDHLIRGQKRKVGVQASRLFVEIPCANVAVIANLALFPPFDGEELAVNLEARDTKNHLYTCLGEAMCHFNIRLLIKSCGKLDYSDHSLAIV